MSGSQCGQRSTYTSKDHAQRDAAMFLSNTQCMHKYTQVQPGVGDCFCFFSPPGVLQLPLILHSPPFFCFQLQNIPNAPCRALRLQSQGDHSTLTQSVQHLVLYKFPSLPLTFVTIGIEKLNWYVVELLLP